jgi:hypothetical protein
MGMAMNIKEYLASIGSRGGKSKSRAKTAAAIANGKLGGRPKTERAIRRQNVPDQRPGRQPKS